MVSSSLQEHYHHPLMAHAIVAAAADVSPYHSFHSAMIQCLRLSSDTDRPCFVDERFLFGVKTFIFCCFHNRLYVCKPNSQNRIEFLEIHVSNK